MSAPISLGSSSVQRFAAANTLADETAQYNDFSKRARKELPELKRDNSTAQYGYEARTVAQFNSAHLVSLTTARYVYSAGAHGMETTTTRNFGLRGGKPVRLRLADVAYATLSARHELELRILGKAMPLVGVDWIEDGSVNSFDDAQLERFWFNKSGLTWEFDPYELGSYASGPFSVRMSWSELDGLLRSDGPLAKLISR